MLQAPRLSARMLSLATALCVLVGCGEVEKAVENAQQASKDSQWVDDLKVLGLLWHNYHDAHAVGPAGWDECLRFAQENGQDAAAIQRLRDAGFDVRWGVNFRDVREGLANTVLAQAPDNDVHLFFDGSVQRFDPAFHTLDRPVARQRTAPANASSGGFNKRPTINDVPRPEGTAVTKETKPATDTSLWLYHQKQGKWVEARVHTTFPNGTIAVAYPTSGGVERHDHVRPDEYERLVLKPEPPTSEVADDSPGPANTTDPRRPAGTPVTDETPLKTNTNVFVKSQGEWSEGVVRKPDADGGVLVQIGELQFGKSGPAPRTETVDRSSLIIPSKNTAAPATGGFGNTSKQPAKGGFGSTSTEPLSEPPGPRVTSDTKLKKNTRVHVNAGGRWVKAIVVVALKTGKVRVRHLEVNAGTVELVSRDRIALTDAKAAKED
ncbi:MAG: hypothetical protein CMJ48_00570 [Planctomycetaceae bacterium]|nr:hypothetical protein [Planctomycetaceae bacterium]